MVRSKRLIVKKGEEYFISPFKALMNDSNYYVLGVDDKGSKIMPYRLDRMEAARETEDKRIGLELFKQIDLRTYTNEIFNMFSGKREYVSIRFTNDLLATMIDRFGEKSCKPYDEYHFVANTYVMLSD